MTISELYRMIKASLSPSLGDGEASATARLLLEDILGVTPIDLVTRGETAIEPETECRFKKAIERIIAGEPPQYITGIARFEGMKFKVTPDTLIPRPETEQLVDIIIEKAKGTTDLKILDIGTGSGCIAISLARGLAFAQVTAIDISDGALQTAKENADSLKAKVKFINADILDKRQLDNIGSDYDIIVSNPPYIAESEKADMEPRVKDFEPASALFVADSDPLVFYKAIARYAQKKSADAMLFFEINPLFAADLQKYMTEAGYECDIVRDSFNRLRFAVCKPAGTYRTSES